MNQGNKKQGKIVSTPVKEVTDGMQVIDTVFNRIVKITKSELNGLGSAFLKPVEIGYTDENNQYRLGNRDLDELKTLVVEFETELNNLVINQLPLKYSQWQSAIDKGEVDSDKIVEFEIISIEHFSPNPNYAKIIPQKQRTYTREELERAWDAGFKRGQVIGGEIDYNKIDTTPTKEEWFKQY